MTDTRPLFDDHVAPAASPAPTSTIAVWRHTRGLGRCRACAGPMTWYRTVAAGRPMPFNADPIPARTYQGDGGRLVDELATADLHWRTCAPADAGRGRRA